MFFLNMEPSRIIGDNPLLVMESNFNFEFKRTISLPMVICTALFFKLEGWDLHDFECS